MKSGLAALAGLSLSLAAGMAPALAQVESREGIALQNQILELRQQMSQLQQFGAQASTPSSLPPPQQEGAPPQMGGESGDSVAQLVVRVAALEEAMRTLQGRVSELENNEHRDHDDLAKQIGDLLFKLGQGGGAQGGAMQSGAMQGGGQPDKGEPPPAAQSGMDLGYTPPPAAPPTLSPVKRPAELALKQGSAALARRDYASAEAAAREVLANGRGPRLGDASFLLARAQAGQHEYKDASVTYFGVYKASPRSARGAEALLGVSNAMIGLNNNALACQALAKLGAEFPRPEPGVRAGMASARKRASCR